ncbi:hypothetical protein HanIR_Chr16g0830281 [Helianthus annuus]|nr:hypothetical protein HanIR_Chr16g0830281 [Helianthus annuus]
MYNLHLFKCIHNLFCDQIIVIKASAQARLAQIKPRDQQIGLSAPRSFNNYASGHSLKRAPKARLGANKAPGPTNRPECASRL